MLAASDKVDVLDPITLSASRAVPDVAEEACVEVRVVPAVAGDGA
jgi:hypothetical protein